MCLNAQVVATVLNSMKFLRKLIEALNEEINDMIILYFAIKRYCSGKID